MAELSEKTIEEIDTAKEAEALRKIEAALFVSGKWMSIPELINLTDLNPILLRQYLDKLREGYNENSAIEIYNRDDLWKMGVKQEYSYLINKLATGSSEFTKAEQETLAIIAYKQPIKQSVIVKIRGNKAYDHIKKFRELGLVNAKRAGHTLELELSDQFYEYFQVNPRAEDVDKIGLIDNTEENTRGIDSAEQK
ncbi:SMC-Scp complex subunit ScpB [Candidatus Pacearchaeota archaeon]|nr:SMC-Scp complex subunit ScpB [Candidatus Pacearchaeota archaeon]